MSTLKFNASKLGPTWTIPSKLEQTSEVVYIGNKEVAIAGVKAKKVLISKFDIERRSKIISRVLITRMPVANLIYIAKLKTIVCLLKDSTEILFLNRDLIVKQKLRCRFVPYTIDFDPTRYLLYIGGDFTTILIYSALNLKLVGRHKWKNPSSSIKSLRVIPKLNYLAMLCTYTYTLTLWRLNDHKRVDCAYISYSYASHYMLSFDPGSSTLALNTDENVTMYQITSKGFENENILSPYTKNEADFSNVMLISPIKCVIATTVFKSVWLWNVETGEVQNKINISDEIINGLTIAPLGKQLVVIVSDSINGNITILSMSKS